MHVGDLYRSEIHGVTGTAAYGHVVPNGGYRHPAVWTGQSWASLLPKGIISAEILGVSAKQQVGYAQGAALWSGTPESYVSLHVPGNDASWALATDGQTQAGYLVPSLGIGHERAVLWRGSAQSAVVLHPANPLYTMSRANAVAGEHQGGFVWYPATGGGHRAALWNGTAESMVLMNPTPGFGESQIFGMAEGQQVGYATPPNSGRHAALWRGTPDSFTDLNPPIANGSRLFATCGSAQVGIANINDVWTAGIWFGTAESFIPLGNLLPPGQYWQSYATSVAHHDGLYYVGGYAWTASSSEAWLWVGVPAPSGLWLLAAAGVAAARRRRR